MLAQPLLNKMPRIRPRKNASSIRGAAIEAPIIFVRENQLIAKRSEKICRASKSAPQQSRGSAAKKNPAARSRDQCPFRLSARSSRLHRRIERNNGQSKRTAASRSARCRVNIYGRRKTEMEGSERSVRQNSAASGGFNLKSQAKRTGRITTFLR